MPRRFDDDDDRDDRPRRRSAEEPSNGAATTALVLGILSLVGGLTAIPGLICGYAGMSKARKLGGVGKGTAVTGTALSGVGLIVLGLTVWLVVWFIGKTNERREQNIATNNVKQIGLALHNQHDASGLFNTGVVRAPGDFNNRPIPESSLGSKLGWRVDILPYIEQDFVYRQMNLSEPWDGPTNRRFADTPVSPYTDPDARTDPATRWRTFFGPGTPFDPANGPARFSIVSITDGTSNTIMVAEAGDKVPWSQFKELKFDPRNPPSGTTYGRPNRSAFQVLLFDGSVREVRKTVSPQSFGAMITHNGGEVVTDFDR